MSDELYQAVISGPLALTLMCRRCGALVESSSKAAEGALTPQQAHTNFHDRIDTIIRAVLDVPAQRREEQEK